MSLDRQFTLEELQRAVEVALRRAEMVKQTQQVMCSKLGMDWDAVCDKARRRIEAQGRVQAQMEAEKAAAALEPEEKSDA